MLILALSALLLGAPTAAWAGNPAQNQYVLPNPSATGSGGGDQGHNRLEPAVATNGSGSDGATIAILAGGVAAIGAAAGIVVYRRRRGRSSESG